MCLHFSSRCDRGSVQPNTIRQPPGAEVQTAGSPDSGGWRGRDTDRGKTFSFFKENVIYKRFILNSDIQDEADNVAERKNEHRPTPLENGLSPTSGPAGHTPIATTPKASAANQQAAATGTTPHSSSAIT